MAQTLAAARPGGGPWRPRCRHRLVTGAGAPSRYGRSRTAGPDDLGTTGIWAWQAHVRRVEHGTGPSYPFRRDAMNDFVSDSGGTRGNARERILVTAYELYARHGVRAVGMDDVAARAGVTRCTLDTLFPSEESLVLAFLTRREEAWTLDMAKDGPGRRAA